MSRAKTPWYTFVTAHPERFSFVTRGTTLLVTAGARHAFCMFDSKTNEIRMDASPGSGELVRAYELKMSNWIGSRPPFLRVHPFVVPHLLATEQVDKQELLTRIANIQEERRATIAVTRSCPMLRTLRLASCPLVFSTNFNLMLDTAV